MSHRYDRSTGRNTDADGILSFLVRGCLGGVVCCGCSSGAGERRGTGYLGTTTLVLGVLSSEEFPNLAWKQEFCNTKQLRVGRLYLGWCKKKELGLVVGSCFLLGPEV